MGFLSRNVQIHTIGNMVIPFKICIKFTFKIEHVFVTGLFYVTDTNFGEKHNFRLRFFENEPLH